MSNDNKIMPGRSPRHYAKIFRYPGGIADIIASSEADFGPKGLEAAEDYSKPGSTGAKGKREHARGSSEAQAEDVQRAMRRARAKVRRLALANDFRWFVTLTLDPSKVEAHDGAAVIRKLNAWCSNAVQRHGLRYILVPERHKKGGIHFHGFFSDSLEAVDSGTIRTAEGKKPRRPRSAAQRAEWLAQGGRIVYNLPGWSLGFTTAMELTGEYPAAVAYVCKYIGKDGEKPAGRWYYSGGDLAQPEEIFAEISPADLREMYPERCFEMCVPGRKIALVNGVTEQERSNKTDIKTWANVCAYLAMVGINSRRVAMILYAMVAEVVTYREAMEAYAEWIGEAPERVHAANCGELLRIGIEQQPGEFLEAAARGGVQLAD